MRFCEIPAKEFVSGPFQRSHKPIFPWDTAVIRMRPFSRAAVVSSDAVARAVQLQNDSGVARPLRTEVAALGVALVWLTSTVFTSPELKG